MNGPADPAGSSGGTDSAELIAYIDGGARGNPGPAGYGVVIQDADGRTRETFSQFLGETTNNVAEYQALLAALEFAAQQPGRRLKVYCDSELVVKQMQGLYRVRSPALKPLYQQAQQVASRLAHFSIEHVPREQNEQADRLANEAMDRGGGTADSALLSFRAIVENGKLQPLPPSPALPEGAEYDVRLRKRPTDTRSR